MPKAFSKIWIVVIIIALLAGGILACPPRFLKEKFEMAWQYFRLPRWEGKAPEEKIEGVTPKKEAVEDKTANWKIYKNDELGISFRYPPEWGELETGEEWCLLDENKIRGYLRDYQGEPCLQIHIKAPEIGEAAIFLASQSVLFANYGPGRGAYFGDLFSLAKQEGIEAEEFVKNYCITHQPKQCDIQTNPNGVLYVKSFEEACFSEWACEDEEAQTPKAFYFFIYHPQHPFPGIVLSNERFLGTPFELNSEDRFDKMLSTFRFLE